MSTQQPHIVHELTDAGIRAAKDYLASLREGRRFPFPETLLTGPQYAAPVERAPLHVDMRFDGRGVLLPSQQRLRERESPPFSQ